MLTIVPTPIGHLEDITLRALNVLKSVELILAEDTRVTKKLLQHYQINKPVKSFHAHNEHKVLASIMESLEAGKDMALVSDAGTPGISDPGFLLVRACVEAEIIVQTLPGATAFVPALVNSGLPCDRFIFEGFLPPKKGRKTRLEQLAQESRTMVFYESPYKIIKTLKALMEHLGADRRASVSREISKIYEEHIRGSLAEIVADLEARPKVKGELVIVVAGMD